jgi:hypothetical protein
MPQHRTLGPTGTTVPSGHGTAVGVRPSMADRRGPPPCSELHLIVFVVPPRPPRPLRLRRGRRGQRHHGDADGVGSRHHRADGPPRLPRPPRLRRRRRGRRRGDGHRRLVPLASSKTSNATSVVTSCRPRPLRLRSGRGRSTGRGSAGRSNNLLQTRCLHSRTSRPRVPPHGDSHPRTWGRNLPRGSWLPGADAPRGWRGS